MKKILTPLFVSFFLYCPLNAKRGCISKAPYAGFGKPSKVNGRIKTKGVHGYFNKRNGYKYTNPYARSK